MAFNPLAGKAASVSIGTVSYAFDEWKATIKNGLSKVTNFTGAGFAQFIAGITDAKVTLSGPYDEGNMAFTVGNAYTLILGYTSMVTLSVPVLLESIEPDVKVEDAQRVSLSFQSTGSFTAAIT